MAEGAESVLALVPPSTMLTTAEGILNRAKLLRAWVETSAWLADYRKRFCESILSVSFTIRC